MEFEKFLQLMPDKERPLAYHEMKIGMRIELKRNTHTKQVSIFSEPLSPLVLKWFWMQGHNSVGVIAEEVPLPQPEVSKSITHPIFFK